MKNDYSLSLLAAAIIAGVFIAMSTVVRAAPGIVETAQVASVDASANN